MLAIAEGVSTWLQNTLEVSEPFGRGLADRDRGRQCRGLRSRSRRDHLAVRDACVRAPARRRSIDHARRHRARALQRLSPPEPGTRSMSPRSSRASRPDVRRARSPSPAGRGSTHTGQPGPWISRTLAGSRSSTPWRAIACVWPPQNSMKRYSRRIDLAGDRRGQPAGQRAVTELIDVLHERTSASRPAPSPASSPVVTEQPGLGEQRQRARASSGSSRFSA